MALPWKTLEEVTTREGVLALRQRGACEFHITLGGLVLMNSMARRSEEALGSLACQPFSTRPAPRALVAGLGLGYTLRAMLDVLPAGAKVTVAELNPVVVAWCRGPLAVLTDAALSDARVTLEVTDVTNVIKRAAESEPFDAIVLDLYTGPHARSDKRDDPFYADLGATFDLLHNLGSALVLTNARDEVPDQGVVIGRDLGLRPLPDRAGGIDLTRRGCIRALLWLDQLDRKQDVIGIGVHDAFELVVVEIAFGVSLQMQHDGAAAWHFGCLLWCRCGDLEAAAAG